MTNNEQTFIDFSQWCYSVISNSQLVILFTHCYSAILSGFGLFYFMLFSEQFHHLRYNFLAGVL